MAKKENLVKLLQDGEVKVKKDAFGHGADLVKVKTQTGSYQFPSEGDQGWKQIERDMASFDRTMANRLNYGDDRGRGAIWRDNTTAKQLGLLAGRPEYISTAWRAWQMAQEAPKNIRRYVYHNLIVWANREHADAEHFMLNDIDPYTFDVLPMAWRKYLDLPVPELENTSVAYQMEDLTPSTVFGRVGQEIAHEQRGYRKSHRVRAVIVGYDYVHRYSLRGCDSACNPYVLEYRCKNVSDDSPRPYIFSVRFDQALPPECADE
jgi:hypothetical protein